MLDQISTFIQVFRKKIWLSYFIILSNVMSLIDCGQQPRQIVMSYLNVDKICTKGYNYHIQISIFMIKARKSCPLKSAFPPAKNETRSCGQTSFVSLDPSGKFYLFYCHRCSRPNLLMCISILMLRNKFQLLLRAGWLE